MTIQEKLLEKGFVEGVDYTFDNNTLVAIVKTRPVESVIHHPEVLDEQGNVLQEASEEVVQTEEQYTELLPDLDSVKMECISDVVIAINEYLSDKKHLITEDDFINISENRIVSFSYAQIEFPSVDTLLACYEVAIAKMSQEAINKEAEEYLKATDWYVTRMVETSQPMPEGMQQLRQAARNRIIR